MRFWQGMTLAGKSLYIVNANVSGAHTAIREAVSAINFTNKRAPWGPFLLANYRETKNDKMRTGVRNKKEKGQKFQFFVFFGK